MNLRLLTNASFWLLAGLIIGVSFVATPAKFLAPSLTLGAAVDVGRSTFHVFNKIELVFVLAMFLLLFKMQVLKKVWIL